MIALFKIVFLTILSLNLKIILVAHMIHFLSSTKEIFSEWDNFWFHISYFQQTVLSYYISFAKYGQLRNLAVNLKAELGKKSHFVLIEFQLELKDTNKTNKKLHKFNPNYHQ